MNLPLRSAIVATRPVHDAREQIDSDRPINAWIEPESDGQGGTVQVATLLLTASECPWRCAMCDLWKSTLTRPTPLGSVPRQLERFLAEVPPEVKWIKLYNSGNFFDAKSIPPADHGAIARLCRPFERVVVENHPRLCGDRPRRFADRLEGRLEVALGVESVQPGMLRRLNKGMTRDHVDLAIRRLRSESIDVRTFLLLRPPWTHDEEAIRWALLALRHVFAAGARHASLIPVRGGNGWLDRLSDRGQFTPPSIAAVESALDRAFNLRPRGVVTADLWDWPPSPGCPSCEMPRRDRLAEMNLTQRHLPSVQCEACSA